MKIPIQRLTETPRPGTIRGRLVRVLTVSLVLVFGLLGYAVVGQLRAYLNADAMTGTTELALAVQAPVHEMQAERDLTNGLVSGASGLVQRVAEQRRRTDRAVGDLRSLLADNHAPGSAETRSAVEALGLERIRAGVDTHSGARSDIVRSYTDRIGSLNRSQFGLAAEPGGDEDTDNGLRRTLKSMYALGDTIELTSRQRGFGAMALAMDRLEFADVVRLIEIRSLRRAATEVFQRNAGASPRAELRGVFGKPAAVRAHSLEDTLVEAGVGALDHRIDPESWWGSMTSMLDDEAALQRSIGAVAEQRAGVVRGHAELELAGFVVAALLVGAIEILLVLGSLRSVLRPLAALADEADDVATRRLPAAVAAWHEPDSDEPSPPDPVRIPRSADIEIVSVAKALDRVQSTAFELASQQAVLRRNTGESLANLGRRNQNLVRRQLALISKLEDVEQAPSVLRNLVELDHLANRLRRNAESLLVLVGESNRRRHSDAVPLRDVVRAAFAEIEDYRRVILRRIDDVLVVGLVVDELAHLLAELIENGLAYSPPESDVEVYGRRIGGRYILAVVDHGVGMLREDLVTANARLRGEDEFLGSSTRFLGHYVVGRLARRLGIAVELTTSPVGGIAARVMLTEELFVEHKELPSATSPTPTPTNDRTPDEVPNLLSTSQPDHQQVGGIDAAVVAVAGHSTDTEGEQNP